MTNDDIAKSCPVAALADEAQRLIDAYNAVDVAEGAAQSEAPKDLEKKIHLENINNATHDYLAGVLDRASFLRATSAKGALFQIGIASSFVGTLDSLVSEARRLGDRRPPQAYMLVREEEKADSLQKAIDRMLYSIACYIESVGDARLEDACGDYFMSRAVNPHSYVDEAFAMLSTNEKRAASERLHPEDLRR
jgi:hypothetical protein